MRDNGHPDWPDPIQDETGNWRFPETAPDVQPPPACTALFRAGKGGGNGPTRQPMSAADIAQSRKWSECIRNHGFPQWPDPDNEGIIDPPAGVQLEGNQQLREAYTACGSVEPTGGPRLKPQRADPGSSAKPQ